MTSSSSKARRGGKHEGALSRDLQRIFVHVPAAVYTTRGPDHLIETANVRYRQLAGHRDVIGKPARAVFPEFLDRDAFEFMDRVYTTGGALRRA